MSRTHFWMIFAAVAGAVVSAIASVLLAYSPAKIEVGFAIHPSLLPAEFQKNLKISYNDAQFTNLSMIEATILNRGILQGDIDKAQLHFTFKTADGKPLPALVSSSLKGPPSLSDVGIEETVHDKDQVVYQIQTLRSASDAAQAYKAAFVFEGNEAPLMTVDTSTANARVIGHRNWIDNIYVLLLVTGGYALIGGPLMFWVIRTDSRTRYRFITRFRSTLTAMPEHAKFDDKDVETIIGVYDDITKPKPFGVRAWIKKKFGEKSIEKTDGATPLHIAKPGEPAPGSS